MDGAVVDTSWMDGACRGHVPEKVLSRNPSLRKQLKGVILLGMTSARSQGISRISGRKVVVVERESKT
jgi:hypothetical protein